jgi:hypothetical protein
MEHLFLFVPWLTRMDSDAYICKEPQSPQNSFLSLRRSNIVAQEAISAFSTLSLMRGKEQYLTVSISDRLILSHALRM